jgi:hypothetical protein
MGKNDDVPRKDDNIIDCLYSHRWGTTYSGLREQREALFTAS